MVALVRGIHGLHGDVRVEVLTDRPEERFAPGTVLHPEGRDDALTISAAIAIPDGPGWRLRFHEIPDRTAAERLRDTYLEVVTGPDGALPRGAYFWHEVIGATVRDVADREVGIVHDIYRIGDAEVVVVRGEPFGEFDVPIVRDVVRIFAPQRGEIVVDVDALGLQPRKPPRPPRPPRPRRQTTPATPANAAPTATPATPATAAPPAAAVPEAAEEDHS